MYDPIWRRVRLGGLNLTVVVEETMLEGDRLGQALRTVVDYSMIID